MIVDELLAGVVRTTGMSLETLFLACYALSLLVVWTGVWLLGTRLYRTPWAVVALAAVMTLRHRIPRTSVNSLEPYFLPRVLAFGLGVIAVAALLRRRHWTAVVLIGAAALVHVTTALWFAVLVGTALAVLDARLRRLVVGSGALAALTLAAAVMWGPLGGTLGTMDAVWLQAVASKDSLFPTDWPAWAWTANLAFFGLLWWAHRTRERRGEASPEDAALFRGAAALVILFLATLPLVAAGVSLAVQFQISRVFWVVELIAIVYVIAVVCDATTSRDRARAIAMALVVLALARGTYIMLIERPERALFEATLPASPWEDAMAWLARQPPGTHVFADPGHLWKYGTSVRVSAQRDVLLEEVKDSALAIYSRQVAERVVERTQAIGDFPSLTPEHAKELARRYDLDFLVTDADLDLPIAYRNRQFRIYSLR
jgi:hypothetical protein